MARVRSRTTYYSSHAIARLVRVSPSTVLSWIDRGLLHAHRTPGGHRRVDGVELMRFLREAELPVPPEIAPICSLLIVDHDPASLGATERELRRLAPGVEVYCASDVIDALLHVSTRRPDAVLLDANMPGLNGVEVCRRLHEAPATRNILLLAVTGTPSPDLAELFQSAGAAECFTKPIDFRVLLRRLGLTLLDQG